MILANQIEYEMASYIGELNVSQTQDYSAHCNTGGVSEAQFCAIHSNIPTNKRTGLYWLAISLS